MLFKLKYILITAILLLFAPINQGNATVRDDDN
jgi:hypothetical protein